jgi:hypothetical protein
VNILDDVFVLQLQTALQTSTEADSNKSSMFVCLSYVCLFSYVFVSFFNFFFCLLIVLQLQTALQTSTEGRFK